MRDKMEDIYIGHCEHLGDGDIRGDQCLKRHLVVFNWQTLKEVKVIICNQYIRLKVHDLMHKKNERFGLSKWDTNRLIIDIIRKEFNDNSFGSYSWDSIKKAPENITFTVCERPYIVQTKSIFEMTEVFMNIDTDYSWILHKIHKEYLQGLKSFCNYYLKYAKYKKDHNNIKKLLKNLEHPYSFKYRKMELTELFNELLIFKTNKL